MRFSNPNKQSSILFSVFLHGVIILSVILFYYLNEEKTLLTAKQKKQAIKAELVSTTDLKIGSLTSKQKIIKAPKKITTPKKKTVPKKSKPKPKRKKVTKAPTKKKSKKTNPSKQTSKQTVASKSKKSSKIQKSKKSDKVTSSENSSNNSSKKVANNAPSSGLSDYAQEQLNYYNKSIYHTLVSSWIRPPGIALGEELISKVLINLDTEGKILKVTIIRSSGNKTFDRYVKAAILKVKKFEIPQDPVLFAEFYENLYIDFTNPRV